MDELKLRDLYEKSLNYPLPQGIECNLNGFLKVSEYASRTLSLDAFTKVVTLITSFQKGVEDRILKDTYKYALRCHDQLKYQNCVDFINNQTSRASKVRSDTGNNKIGQTSSRNQHLNHDQPIAVPKSKENFIPTNSIRLSEKNSRSRLKRQVTDAIDSSSDSEPELSHRQGKNYIKFTKSKNGKLREFRNIKEKETLHYGRSRKAQDEESEDSDSLFKPFAVKRLPVQNRRNCNKCHCMLSPKIKGRKDCSQPSISGFQKKSSSKRYMKGQPKQPFKSYQQSDTDSSHSDSEVICIRNSLKNGKNTNKRAKCLSKYDSKTEHSHDSSSSQSPRSAKACRRRKAKVMSLSGSEALADSSKKASKGNSRRKKSKETDDDLNSGIEASNPERIKRDKRHARVTSLSESEVLEVASKKQTKGKRRSKSLVEVQKVQHASSSLSTRTVKAKTNKSRERVNSHSDSEASGTSKNIQNKKNQLPNTVGKQLKTTKVSSKKTSSKNQRISKNASIDPSPRTPKTVNSKFINPLKELESSLLVDAPNLLPKTNKIDSKSKKNTNSKTVTANNKKSDSKKVVKGCTKKSTPKQNIQKSTQAKSSAKAKASDQKSTKGFTKPIKKSGALKNTKEQAKKTKKSMEPKQNVKKKATNKKKTCNQSQNENTELLDKKDSDENEENDKEKQKSLQLLTSSEESDSEIEPEMGTMSVCLNSIKKHLPRQVGTATPPLRAFLTAAGDRTSDASMASSDEMSVNLDDKNVVKRMAKVNRLKRKEQGDPSNLPILKSLDGTPESLRKMVKLKKQLDSSDEECSSFFD